MFSKKSVSVADAGFDAQKAASPTSETTPPHANDERPVIVMIHGMWSQPAVWHPFKAFFEAKGFRVLTPLLRHHDTLLDEEPHGELGKTSTRDYVEDILAMIHGLKHPPILMGHSMGALLAQMVSARAKVRATILLASAPIAGTARMLHLDSWRILGRQVAHPFAWRKARKPTYEAMRYGLFHGLSESRSRQMFDQVVWESGRAICEICFHMFDRHRSVYIQPDEINTPLLFLTGTEDRLTPTGIGDRTARHFGENATFEAIHGRAHWLISEPGWEDVASRSLDFINWQLDQQAESQAL